MAVLLVSFVSLALLVVFEKGHRDGGKEVLWATGSEEVPAKTTYYARVVGGAVTHILLSDPESIKTVPGGPDARWIETVKTAEGGIRYDPGAVDNERKGMLRKNPAEVGFSYDEKLDCFIPFRPHKSWTFDKDTCRWDPPVAYPADGKPYEWNEEKRKWVEVILPTPGTCSSKR